MTQPTPKTIMFKWSAISTFGILALAALAVFMWGAGHLAASVVTNKPLISVNTGMLRMLGIAIGLGVITGLGISESLGLFKKFPKLDKILGKVLIGGLALIFLFPTMVHIPLERYLFSEGYKICQPKSEYNRSFRVVVYVKDVPTCLSGLKNTPTR